MRDGLADLFWRPNFTTSFYSSRPHNAVASFSCILASWPCGCGWPSLRWP